MALRSASDTRLSLRRREQVFTRLSKSYKENMDISSTRSSSSSSSSSILPCIFFVFLFLPGSVDATRRISSSSLRMCARQDCFVFERPQVVFYCNFSSSRHVSKSANLIGRIVFDAVRQTKNDTFTRGVFRVGVHTHIGALCLVTRR